MFAFLLMAAIPIFNILYVERAQQGNFLVYKLPDGALKLADFVPFYYAGKVVLSGESKHAYDPAVRMRISNQLVAPYTSPRPLYCGYMPFVFVLMVPFAMMPLLGSFYFWCFFTTAFGLTCLTLFLHYHMRWKRRYIALFCLVSLWSLVSLLNLYIGQVGWFLLGLDTLFFWGLLSNRDRMGGIALTLTTIKPQYAVIFFGAAVGLRRWRLLGVALITEVALFAAAVLVLGPTTVGQYGELLKHTETVDLDIFAMASIRPVLAMVLPHAPALAANLIILAAATGAVALLWNWKRKSGADVFHTLIAVTVLAALIASPHTHCHDCIMLALVAAVSPWRKRDCWEAKTWLVMLAAFPLAGFLFYAMPASGPWMRWPFLLYNITLLMLSLLYLRRLTKSDGSSPSSSVA